MSIYVEDNDKHVVRSYYTSPKIEETIESLLKYNKELIHSESLPGYKVDIVEIEQESMLDKIRAEIEGIIQEEIVIDNSGGEYERVISKVEPDDVLQIIDKYKTRTSDASLKWEPGNSICPCCGEDKFKGLDADIWSDWQPKFCPNCGTRIEGDYQE